MSKMSDYLENLCVRHFFWSDDFPAAPATVYFSLHTADPGETGTSEVTTAGGTQYARKGVTVENASWTALSGMASSNDIQIDFDAGGAPAGPGWGTIVGWGIWDASTSGNLLFYGSFGTSKTVNAGDASPYIADQTLTLTFGGAYGQYAAEQILLHWLRTGSATSVTNLYASLHVGAPGVTGGTNEVTGGGYARADGTLAASSPNWNFPSNGAVQNTNEITYSSPTSPWGTITHAAVHTASTGSANCIWQAALTTSKIVNQSDPAPKWPVGDLDISFT